MKYRLTSITLIVIALSLNSCKQKEKISDMNIIYLHHSTGAAIWEGRKPSIITRAARKISPEMADIVGQKAILPKLFQNYNRENDKNDHINIKEMAFPKDSPYGWYNFPYDYYNIWVKNAGNQSYMGEPTLEILTKEYQVIIFKHCYPVSHIQVDQDSADINSKYQSLANYKLQYEALRNKIHEFPKTKFILFTGAALVRSAASEDEAKRAREFFTWVKDVWDQPGDNIYIWDLYNLETEGGVYFKDEYAVSPNDSHPNGEFAGKAAHLLFNRIIDVIEKNGTGTKPTGEKV
jgi:hypothetical protein